MSKEQIAVEWENGEYYCEFGFCTPDGCRGHDSGWPHELYITIPGAHDLQCEVEWDVGTAKEQAQAAIKRIGDTQAARLSVLREIKEWAVTCGFLNGAEYQAALLAKIEEMEGR